jgi:hypothetical protein
VIKSELTTSECNITYIGFFRHITLLFCGNIALSNSAAGAKLLGANDMALATHLCVSQSGEKGCQSHDVLQILVNVKNYTEPIFV